MEKKTNKVLLSVIGIILIIILGVAVAYLIKGEKQLNKETNNKVDNPEYKTIEVLNPNVKVSEILQSNNINVYDDYKIILDYSKVLLNNNAKVSLKLTKKLEKSESGESNIKEDEGILIINDKEYQTFDEYNLVDNLKIVPFQGKIAVINESNQYTGSTPGIKIYNETGLLVEKKNIVTEYSIDSLINNIENYPMEREIKQCPITVTNDEITYCEMIDTEIKIAELQKINFIKYRNENDYEITDTIDAYLTQES